MCLILFAYRAVPQVPLLVAANRDEFHRRASAPADFWSDTPHVLAGRDLEAGGTWLGCNLSGRFAALTNFSNPTDAPAKYSRGRLVQEFLQGDESAQTYSERIEYPSYAGFNLLLFDGDDLIYASNKADNQVLEPGYHGLSNAAMGAPWPKCTNGAAALRDLAERSSMRGHSTGSNDIETQSFIDLLGDRAVPADDQLPQRGRDIEMERRTAPCFILGDEYGTRASTLVRISKDSVAFTEQLFAAGGKVGDRAQYHFSI